jgi:hypothetical protein
MKGYSKLKKAELEEKMAMFMYNSGMIVNTAYSNLPANKSSSTSKVSRKPKRKVSRKPKRKVSRKPKRKVSRKPKRKVSRKPKRRASRKPKRKASRKHSKKSKKGKKKYFYYPCDMRKGLNSKTEIYLTDDEILTYPRAKIDGVPQSWDTFTLKKGALLFRGEKTTRKNTLLDNMKRGEIRPTWYTDILSNAVGYMPTATGKTKGGYLYVYEVTKDLTLFNVNSARNINQLIHLAYDRNTDALDETPYWMHSDRDGTKTAAKQAKIRSGNCLYEILDRTFLSGGLQVQRCFRKTPRDKGLCDRVKNGTLLQKDMNRGSVVGFDNILSDWLCHSGFDGWHQGPEAKSQVAPEEMICKPKDCLKLVRRISYPKGWGGGMGLRGSKNREKATLKAVGVLNKMGRDPMTYYQYARNRGREGWEVNRYYT